jgi:hypothetical protein
MKFNLAGREVGAGMQNADQRRDLTLSIPRALGGAEDSLNLHKNRQEGRWIPLAEVSLEHNKKPSANPKPTQLT